MDNLPIETPLDSSDLGRIVGNLTRAGRAVYPVGGATGLDYGHSPTKPGVRIDLTRLDRVIDYPFDDMTITVEAGMRWANLTAILAEHGQRLPVDVPHPDRATVGGAIAVDVSGPRRLGRGTFRDWIIGITVVNDRGEFCSAGGRVVKNVAGYDLGKLYTGSLGSFGFISRVTFKLQPIPPAQAWMAWPVPEQDVAKTLDVIHSSATRPVAVDLLNARGARATGLDCADGEAAIAVLFEDSIAAVDWQAEQVTRELAGAPRRLAPERARAMEARLVSSPAVEGCDVSLLVTTRPSAVAECFARTAGDGVWHAQAMSGIVRIGRSAAPAEWATHVANVVGPAGGNVVVRRWPANVPDRPAVWGRPTGGLAMMQAVKAQFDPRGLLNPGRTAYG
ncbi:MAG: FAD-binding oxidoreductase [Gemmataceae bacterium]|nr:FAD-binding oxidoreductase [Gemmataceae bacterium]